MSSVAQIHNKLTHLAHIEQLPCFDSSLAGSHMQQLLTQVTG
ncbi:hypothetical protein EVA_09912 [gut metagenome]|uniref:Uncharacterized protein n=1 Tax=gut metagenome TaxID=749906 RepID=J9GJ05_9ZZZZ